MKKFLLALVLVMATVSGWSQLLKYEPFNYTPHATNGLYVQSSTAWERINSGDSVLVDAGSLNYAGLPTSVGNKVKFDGAGADYYTVFSSQTSGTVFTSFIMNVSSLGLVTTGGTYFTGLLQDASPSAFGATVWVRLSTTAGKYNLGISTRSSSSIISWLPTELDPGTSYFVVTSYDIVTGSLNDFSRIWLNPVPGSAEPTASATAASPTGSELTSVARVFIRQDATTPFVEMDEIRIGTTYASVTPSGSIADPTTTSISPTSATAGGAGFTLTVNGTNFVSGSSTVTWNGSARTTTFVSSTQLTASILASDIAAAGTALVGVTTTGATNPSNTQTFTINASATPTLSATALAGFGNVCINTDGGPNSFTITGTDLTAANVTVAALPGFSYSTTAGGTYTSTLSFTQPGGSFSQQVFVKFSPTAVQSYNGDIAVGGGGASSINVAATGSGINTPATVTSGAATAVTAVSATLPGTITVTGCGTVTAYGNEYSTTSGFANGTGTSVAGSNLSGSSFSVNVTGLTPSTSYYYKAWATTSAGTSYSTQQFFATTALPAPVATAATAVGNTGFTANWNAVNGATNYYLDVYTKSPGIVTSVVSGWNFDVASPASLTADSGNVNNISIQVLDTNGTTAAITYPGGPTSSSGINPFSASTTTWDGGQDAKYWQVDVNTTGATNITVSSLQGSSGTGPAHFKLQYRVGTGGTWTDVTGGAINITQTVSAGSATTWAALNNVALPAAADNQPLVSLRWIMTDNLTLSGGTVASGGTSRISAIYIKGDGPGLVNNYVAGYQNLSVGNVTSYAVTGLNPGTDYYYVVRAEAGGVSSANSNEIAVSTTAPPSTTVGTLAPFGNVCINTTAGPNSFTISGSNLSGDLTVGALAGYSYSTSSGGTYTSTLTLTPSSGSVNETVYVKFTPTAVQSYDGVISVSGGGAPVKLVNASGAGINDAPTVTTGAASSITTTSATAAGAITANGCSAITSYGIEYSTTNGFANGTGTQVGSTNLVSPNFSSSLAGLTASTVYYYKAYAVSASGTSYGAQQSFTTLTPASPSLTAGTLTAFGSQCINTTAGPNSFTLSGSDLTAANVTVGPLPGYSFSLTSGGTYTSTVTITPSAGAINETIYVKFTPTAVQSYNGNIPVSGGGAASINVVASGSGINTAATVTTGAASAITSTGATVAGAIPANGCSAITAYGFEWSTTNGFTNGTGTQVTSSNLVLPNFSASISGLTATTVYYYKAWATTGAGTSYGTQQNFTTLTPALTAGSVTDFGSVNAGSSSASQSFNISGTNLTGAPGVITITAPSTDFQVSNDNSTWGSSTTIAYSSSTLAATPVYVRFTPQSAGVKTGNVTVSGGGAATQNVAVSGTGLAITPPVAPVATAATVIGQSGFTANWNAVAGATGYWLDVYTLTAGSGSVIAGWNFDVNSTANQVSDTGNTNNINIQTVTTGGGTSAISSVGGPTPLTGINPYAATATGWDNGAGTKYWQVDVNTTGATNLTVSSMQGSSGGGPKEFKLQYRVGSTGTWIDVTGGVVTMTVAASGGNSATWVALTDLPLPAAAENQPLVSLRWIMTSNTPNTTGTAVANTGTSRISAIYIKSGTGGSGTPVYVAGYQNLSVGNVTSYAVTGLSASTNYYYVVRAENAGGASPNSNEISVATLAGPVLSTSSLTAFGNTCLNTTTAANSFTLTGSNLSNANITVGPLAGYTFSTTSGGVYTNSLTITQPGGSFSQTIFVKLTPTAVQSYSGNIPVTGGGVSTTVNVAASGAGVNTAPTVTTGAATSVTNVSATAPGTITATGCTATSAYGIEYSTTNGFANGTGTTVASTNLSGGNFSSSLTGLTANTTYYFKAFATNAGGTSYGAQQSFTTLATAPVVLSATTLTAFGSNCLNTTTGPNSFTITGSNLTNAPVTVAALAGFSYSTTANGTYTPTLSITQPGGTFSQQVFVKFTPVANQSYNGNIVVSGGGATAINVAASGTGSSVAPTVTTGSASAITTHSATVEGSVTSAGCPNVTDLGIEYSTINNFIPGTGTKVSASNLSSTPFNITLNNLVQGAVYYYRAFASNAGGTGYGNQQTFTVKPIENAFTVYPSPVRAGTAIRFSMNNLEQGYHGLVLYNSLGQKVAQKNYNVQSSYLNEEMILPASLPTGIYRIQIVTNTDVLETRTILITNN
jgi:hypothetical protein